MSLDTTESSIFQASESFEEKCRKYIELHPWIKNYPYIQGFLRTRFLSEFYGRLRFFNVTRKNKDSLYFKKIEDLESLIDVTDIHILNAVIITLRFARLDHGDFGAYYNELVVLLEWRIEQLNHQDSTGVRAEVATRISNVIGK